MGEQKGGEHDCEQRRGCVILPMTEGGRVEGGWLPKVPRLGPAQALEWWRRVTARRLCWGPLAQNLAQACPDSRFGAWLGFLCKRTRPSLNTQSQLIPVRVPA
jgi:hypothetical protein